MDTQTYEGLIRQLEAKSENNPTWFRSQVFLMTNCAYLVLLCIFALAISLFYLAYQWQQSGSSGLGFLIGLAVAIIPAMYVSIKAFLYDLMSQKALNSRQKMRQSCLKFWQKCAKN